MKTSNIFQILVMLFCVLSANAQQGFNYKAIINDANGDALANTLVTVQFTILENGTTNVFQETYSETTDANGILIVNIGEGTLISGDFSTIDWASNPHFLKTEINTGDGLADMGTTEFKAVPYALHAETANNVFSGDYNDLTNLPEGTAPGEIRYWNGSEWVNIIPGVDEQILMFIGGIPQWTTYQPGIATVITDSVYNINGHTAFVDANVSSEGGIFVSERGILWNENPDLNTNDDNKISRGSSSGTYTTEINSLSPSTIYYTCAYAINSAGTDYGDELSFNTTNGLPILIISDITDITDFSATSVVTITDNNGFAITARGVCWSTIQNPTINDSHTTDGTGLGSFISSITGLLDATTYYVRAYATNSIGTGYSNEQSFITTHGCIDYDGNIYQTVIIGNQKWMAENLKVTHYPNGDEIPLVTDNTAWGNLDYINTDDAYCYYNNNSSNEKDTYGALYTYAAAIGDNWARDNVANQGVCPDGWHLPNDFDWTELTDYLGGESVAGGKMKEIGITHWNSPNTGATNESGFTALPGGSRHYGDGTFNNLGYDGHWWSVGDFGNDRGLYYNHDNIVLDGYEKSHGFSVRCVRD